VSDLFDNTRYPFGLPQIESDNPSVRKYQERILAELLGLLNGYDVPTYFDQLTPNKPRDERQKRQVMEPATRIRWVFDRYGELKTKNARLSEHATELEGKLQEVKKANREKEAALYAALEQRDIEILLLKAERDKALKELADLMANPPKAGRSGRRGSKASPR
jgi:DNA repair exonuclease SbcCD ATPase subunit